MEGCAVGCGVGSTVGLQVGRNVGLPLGLCVGNWLTGPYVGEEKTIIKFLNSALQNHL